MKLAEYINSHHIMSFKALVYTSKDALQKCINKYDIELLVISGVLAKDEIIGVDAKTVVVLYDAQADIGNDFNYVCKYQPADHLVKEIMSYLSGYSKHSVTDSKSTEVSCVYSPATKCFKTKMN